mgnify:CR=1 FL=1
MMINNQYIKDLISLFKKTKHSSSFSWEVFYLKTSLNCSFYTKQLLEPISNEKLYKILELGLHEALINAVKHGNNYDTRKFLRVRRIITPNWYVWQIQDEGSGVPKSLRKFNLPSKIDSNTGRGLFIIMKSFDDIRWSSSGSRIQLATKRNVNFTF